MRVRWVAASGGQKERQVGWFEQDKNEDTNTQVKSGYSHDQGRATSEFVIADRDGSGHQHVVLDDHGNEIHNQRTDDR